MPRYDIACETGHQHEVIESRETAERPCPQCNRPAKRVILPGHIPSANGFTLKPTKEHYVPLGRAIEAQHEIIHQAEKHGVTPPDLWATAKARVKRGDVVAIT